MDAAGVGGSEYEELRGERRCEMEALEILERVPPCAACDEGACDGCDRDGGGSDGGGCDDDDGEGSDSLGKENDEGALEDRISRELLLSCVKKNTKQQEGETEEHYLGKITHVNLAGKGLTGMKGLERCRRMQTLYLYENAIDSLTPLSFARGLTHLYLQHNSLSSFHGLGELPLLSKLSADYNRIETVSDLEGCTGLAELHLSHQQLEPGSPGMSIAPPTVAVLRECLQSIAIRGCALRNVGELGHLSALESIDGAESGIDDIAEVEGVLRALPNITRLNLSGCPVTKTRKYRDSVVLAGLHIAELDGKPVRDDERLFLIRMTKNSLRKKMAGMKT